MATSVRQFRVELYEEHLEEASFLYEQCRALLQSAGTPWMRLGDFQERLEAHLDALVVGSELALDVCRRRAVEGDVGELFAAVCVFCRYAEATTLKSVLRDLDCANAERSQAITDALKNELPEEWGAHCLRAVTHGEGPRVSILGTVIGYRRLPNADVICAVLGRASPPDQRALLWAIGRTRPTQASTAIRPFLQSTDGLVRDSALRAGLRVHDSGALSHLYALANAGQCPPVELGLVGARASVAALVAVSRAPDATADAVVALGLLGDLSAVGPLLELLGVERLARRAAEALYVITGAPLFSDAQVLETVTEDEMFDDELTAFRETGAVPGRGDGQPYATTVRQLTTDLAAWNGWLKANAARFSSDRRYRLGLPYHPPVLLQCLCSETYPKTWRGLAAEELLVRYGVDLPFEVDMPVARQIRVLRDAAVPVTQAAQTVDPGRWYVAGQLV